MIRRPPRFPLFPYPTPFRSPVAGEPMVLRPLRALLTSPQVSDVIVLTQDPEDLRPVLPEDSRVSLRASRILGRSEEHTSELQSQSNLVCRLLLEKKKNTHNTANEQIRNAARNFVSQRIRIDSYITPTIYCLFEWVTVQFDFFFIVSFEVRYTN